MMRWRREKLSALKEQVLPSSKSPIWKTWVPRVRLGARYSQEASSEGWSHRSSKIKWSGQEQRSRSRLRGSEAEAAHRAKKRETEPTSRSKNLEPNSSPEIGQAKSGHPSSPQGQSRGWWPAAPRLPGTHRFGSESLQHFGGSKVFGARGAVSPSETQQSPAATAPHLLRCTHRGSCEQARWCHTLGVLLGHGLSCWLVLAACPNELAEVCTKTYSC